MAGVPGSSNSSQSPSVIPRAALAWALSAVLLGAVYALPLAFATAVILLTVLYWLLLVVLAPLLVVSVGFILGGFGVLSGRPGARSRLRTCAGIAAAGNSFVAAYCVAMLAADFSVRGAVDYRVVTLAVSAAQLLYCLGLVWYLGPRSSTAPQYPASDTASIERSLWPTVWAIGRVTVAGVAALLVWLLSVAVTRPAHERVQPRSVGSIAGRGAQPRQRQASTSTPGGRQASQTTGANSLPPTTPSGAGQQRPWPTPEQIKIAARELEQAAPALHGTWLYPGARMIPFEPRPGPVAFPIMTLQTTDDLQAVIRFYDRLAVNGRNTAKGYILDGRRPGDGLATEIWIGTSQGVVFVRFDVVR